MTTQSYVGEILVSKVSIIGSNGKAIDITKVFTIIEIRESIFQPTMVGTIEISDGSALTETTPLTGNELIEISFKNPAANNTFHLRFNIIELANRVPMEGNKMGMTYVLHFISGEAIKSSLTRISKKYKGTITQIVNSIYNEYLRIDPPRRKISIAYDSEGGEGDFFADRAVNSLAVALREGKGHLHITNDASIQQEIVVPNWNPLATIEVLSERAVAGQSPAVNFVFFETLANFHFLSIDSLLRNPPKRSYSYGTKNLMGGSVEKESQFIMDFKINKSFQNPISALSTGMYSSTLITHDITRKKIEEFTYNYRNSFGNRAHLGKHPLIGHSGIKAHKAAVSNVYMYPKHKGLHDGLDNSNNAENWIMQGNSHMQEITAISATAILPGDSDVSAGDIVDFDLNVFAGQEPIKNTLIGGAYIIINLEHQFTKTEYQMKVDITKDSFGESIELSPEDSGEINAYF